MVLSFFKPHTQQLGKKIGIAIAITLSLYAQMAMAQETEPNNQPTILQSPTEQWDDFAQEKTAETKTINSVFMRSTNNTAGKAINIFINGEYFTSLLPGGYKKTLLCQGRNYIGVAVADSGSRYAEKENPKYAFDLQQQEIQYFQVMVNNQGQAIAQAVKPKQARKLLRGLKKQNHSVPRLEKNRRCMPKTATQAQ